MGKFHLGDMSITSPAFEHGERIPDRYTVNGEDISPELNWNNIPEGTKEFALVCHDPDAPLTYGYTHWIVYGIPGDAHSLSEGATEGFKQGHNDFDRLGYGGPAPPEGHGTHFYYFHLYALSENLNLDEGLTHSELLAKIDDVILVQARLVGTYNR